MRGFFNFILKGISIVLWLFFAWAMFNTILGIGALIVSWDQLQHFAGKEQELGEILATAIVIPLFWSILLYFIARLMWGWAGGSSGDLSLYNKIKLSLGLITNKTDND